ncbi:hypothetical protein LX59_00874 [Azomonas agilis]|uniref:DUF4440 domain-containing protein n=1 Tax=Azomonas agilis TaxID=116849 RepID=A0A562J0M6_9GAMM|nr:DUF4440 domain-containing protein [Azomonas agilis]TWH76829.1 hypothetical protein LX59_00874 [Azomonas agilis]
MVNNTPIPTDLTQILEQLKALEPLIYCANSGACSEHFERLLVQDFWEVGASGKIYDRAFVLSVLKARQQNPIQEPWHTFDYQIRPIETQHFLITYSLQQATRLSRRATLWQNTEQGWKMLYHQGTVVV